MKIYGRKPITHNFPDIHPPKGYINWWEDINRIIIKKSARQDGRKIIRKELENNESKN